ncbi:hypothetical protein [Streptomyces sp. NPDC054834]
MGENLALVTPVRLCLGSRDDLETAVEIRKFTRSEAQCLRDIGPGFLEIKLQPLVVAGETVLLDQPLVDDRTLDRDLGSQHRVDQRSDLVNHPVAWPTVGRPTRWATGAWADRRFRDAP